MNKTKTFEFMYYDTWYKYENGYINSNVLVLFISFLLLYNIVIIISLKHISV